MDIPTAAPYYFKKNWWHKTLDKNPIRHLEEHILQYSRTNNLTLLANQTHQIHKWLKIHTSTRNCQSIYVEAQFQLTIKLHVSLNFILDNVRVKPTHNFSLVENPTPREHALFATHMMQILGYIFYQNANNKHIHVLRTKRHQHHLRNI